MYKLSHYNKIWELASGEFVILNSLSGGVYRISAVTYNLILMRKWHSISEITIGKLLEAYVLIPDGIESKDIFEFEMLSVKAQTKRLGIFMVPSRICNLECVYCVQNNLFSNQEYSFITTEIIDKYYDWIQHKLNKWGTKKLEIIFYGGEPLTTDICVLQYMFDKFDELSVSPIYGMITNGVNLLDYEHILPKMRSIQITIDGSKTTHDTRRVFKDGSGSFDVIMANIIRFLSVSKRNNIILRMNVDRDNRERLWDDLKGITSLLPMEQVQVSLNPIDPYSCGITDETLHGNIAETARAITSAYRDLKNTYGTEPHIWRLNCGVSSLCQWSFDTDGSIYKCPAYTGMPDRAVCNVMKPHFNSSFYSIMQNTTNEEDCLKCAYLGYCYGGCMRQRELVGKKSCKKIFFDEYLPRMIELKYSLNPKSDAIPSV